MLARRTTLLSILAILVVAAGAALLIPRYTGVTSKLPESYTDAEFWRIVTEFSEHGGFFRSDNFVSNETSFQTVIPDLRRKTKPGGIYIGVGPDQNFTYLAAMKPKFAFVVDIRRQNMLQLLLYKALFEMSENRAQFLSRLFSRAIPKNLPAGASLQTMLDGFATASPNDALFRSNLDDVINRLTNIHGFQFEPNDASTIEYIYHAFFSAGPEIRYSFPSQYGWRRFPSYAELMLETDRQGVNHSYIASEENFRFLKQMEEQNRIVPLVGDFAGDKTLRRLGAYLSGNGATVAAFYTSNVEYYLFQNEDWRKFFKNVGALPLDADSTFIRAYFNNQRLQTQFGIRPITLLDNMQEQLAAVNHGQIRSYEEVIRRSP